MLPLSYQRLKTVSPNNKKPRESLIPRGLKKKIRFYFNSSKVCNTCIQCVKITQFYVYQGYNALTW